MIRAPEQPGARRRRLPPRIVGVAHVRRIRRFMNNADDPLPPHQIEIDAHQVIVRQVHDAVARAKGSRRKREQEQEKSAD